MSWQHWIVVAWLALNSLAIIGYTGRPRPPVTPGAAVFAVIINASLAFLIATG